MLIVVQFEQLVKKLFLKQVKLEYSVLNTFHLFLHLLVADLEKETESYLTQKTEWK